MTRRKQKIKNTKVTIRESLHSGIDALELRRMVEPYIEKQNAKQKQLTETPFFEG